MDNKSQHVSIVPINSSHVSQMYKWLQDQNLTKFLLFETPKTVSSEREWVETMIQSDNDFVFAIYVNNEYIGNIGLHEVDTSARTAVVGLFIGDEKMRGKGYGSDALRLILKFAQESLNVATVTAPIFKFNSNSVRLFESLGFKKFKEEIVFKGDVPQELVYYVLSLD